MIVPGLQPQPVRLATPLEDHLAEAGLLVKREDLSCPPPGPPFSKTRGVYAHMKKRVAEGVKLFGALDTFHSQAGHAVAHAARLLGVDSVNYFPVYKAEWELASDTMDTDEVVLAGSRPADPPFDRASRLYYARTRPPQLRSKELGAELVPLPAGRSAVLYHTAKRDCAARGGYMMPNALKLPETVQETAAEVVRTFEHATRAEFEVLRSSPWLISCSSATIASGVAKGLAEVLPKSPLLLFHMGYSRSWEAIDRYVEDKSGIVGGPTSVIIDEGYAYKDVARPGPTPPWPCNPYYDLKAVRWWLAEGRAKYGRAVLWNIG